MNRPAVVTAAFALLLAARSARPQETPVPPSGEPLYSAWVRSAARVVGVCLSPEGERILTTTVDGDLRAYTDSGELAWELHGLAVDTVLTSRKGAVTLAYAQRRPLARKVFFLDGSGRTLGTVEPVEPVEAAALSPDGRFAAVAAGRSILFCTIGRRQVTKRTLSLEGRPVQLQMGPDDTVYAACVEPEYVALLRSSGKGVWRRQEASLSNYAISAGDAGRQLAISAESGSTQIQTWLVTARNSARWSDTRPGRQPRPRLSAAGAAVMLSYNYRVEGARGPRLERRLTYLAPGAGGAWPKGGPFNTQLPVAIEPKGEWLVALEQPRGAAPRFRLFGKGGERRWLYVSPANILIAAGSDDGRHIVTYRTDGFLEMLRVTSP